MKKNVLKVAFVATVTIVSGVNVFNAQKIEDLSETVLANVEALAELENKGDRSISDTLVSMTYNPYSITATYERTCPYGGVHQCSSGTYTITTPMY